MTMKINPIKNIRDLFQDSRRARVFTSLILLLLICKERANGLRYHPRSEAEWDRALALRAVALGRAWILFGSRKNSKPRMREMLDAKRAARPPGSPQRQMHAVLGSALTRHLTLLPGDVGNPAPFHKICPCGFHP